MTIQKITLRPHLSTPTHLPSTPSLKDESKTAYPDKNALSTDAPIIAPIPITLTPPIPKLIHIEDKPKPPEDKPNVTPEKVIPSISIPCASDIPSNTMESSPSIQPTPVIQFPPSMDTLIHSPDLTVSHKVPAICIFCELRDTEDCDEEYCDPHITASEWEPTQQWLDANPESKETKARTTKLAEEKIRNEKEIAQFKQEIKAIEPKPLTAGNGKPFKYTEDAIKNAVAKLKSFKPVLSPTEPPSVPPSVPHIPIGPIPQDKAKGLHIEGLVDQAGVPIILDADQHKAVELALLGQSMSIVGKAGTGKTTTVQAISLSWLSHSSWHATSYRQQGTGLRFMAPSIAIVAATNRAADNMRDKLVAHSRLGEGEDAFGFGPNVTTIHNLLEYTVEFLLDPETGNKKPHYYPLRDALNKLDITHLVVEEATLAGVGDKSIWEQLRQALPKGVQILFLGDLNQLPPVIGKSVLNYSVQSLPLIELTHVHRQALDNPIIRQALRCIEGQEIKEDFIQDEGIGVRIFNGKAKHKMSVREFELACKRLFGKLIDAEQFDPMIDMVLSPYNKRTEKAVSSTNLANVIGTLLAARGDTPVHEIRAGFALLYLRVGDRVFVDKKEGIVIEIAHNSAYYGKMPQPASLTLDYFGLHSLPASRGQDEIAPSADDDWLDDYSALSLEDILAQEDVGEEERKRAGSHSVTVSFSSPNNEDEDIERTYNAVGEIANIVLGYALSVHKSQGSEWPRVILALHQSNATNLFRELIYTAMTRPRYRLDIVAQAPTIVDACSRQRIKGSTLAAKIEFFNSGYLDQDVELEP